MLQSILSMKLTSGLAVDEAILAGAMVGSLGIFGAVVLPWDSIFQEASVQMVEDLEAVEEANTRFFAAHGKWPYVFTNGNKANNASVLATSQALHRRYQGMQTYRTVLTSIPFDVSGQEISLRHSYGEGGRILQERSDHAGYNMKVTFENVSFSKMKQLDADIDGEYNPDKGRIRAIVRNGVTDMVYYANPRNTKTAAR